MDDPSGVAKVDAIDELEHEQPNLLLRDGIFVLRQVFLEIIVGVFKHQVQLLFTRGVDDVHEAEWCEAYLTILGCGLSSLRMEISLMAVDGTPSSSFSNLIFFKATSSLVFLSLARYTTP